jgi:hypothetical protein
VWGGVFWGRLGVIPHVGGVWGGVYGDWFRWWVGPTRGARWGWGADGGRGELRELGG